MLRLASVGPGPVGVVWVSRDTIPNVSRDVIPNVSGDVIPDVSRDGSAAVIYCYTGGIESYRTSLHILGNVP